MKNNNATSLKSDNNNAHGKVHVQEEESAGSRCEEANETLIERFLENVKRDPHKIMFVHEKLAEESSVFSFSPLKSRVAQIFDGTEQSSRVKGKDLETVSTAVMAKDLAGGMFAVAQLLVDSGCKPGDVCVLVYPPGRHVYEAVLACLATGIVPALIIPPTPADKDLGMGMLQHVVQDCGAKFVCTSSEYMDAMRLGMLLSLLGRGDTATTHA